MPTWRAWLSTCLNFASSARLNGRLLEWIQSAMATSNNFWKVKKHRYKKCQNSHSWKRNMTQNNFTVSWGLLIFGPNLSWWRPRGIFCLEDREEVVAEVIDVAEDWRRFGWGNVVRSQKSFMLCCMAFFFLLGMYFLFGTACAISCWESDMRWSISVLWDNNRPVFS